MKNVRMSMNKFIRRFIYSISMLSLIVLFNSCKHDNFEEFVGPGACPSSNFTSSFNVSAANVNFQDDSLRVTATFNESVFWTVSITGQTSGAVRTYSGRSNSVDIEWRGQPGGDISNVKFFANGENVEIKLQVSCKDPVSQTVTIMTTDFTTYRTSGAGILISDFDGKGLFNGSYATVPTPHPANGWLARFESPNVIYNFGAQTGPLTSPQGTNYLGAKGTTGVSSWYTGGIESQPTILLTGSSGIKGFSGNAKDIYFNAFLNNGGNSTTLVSITLGTGLYPNNINYNYNLKLDWTGWRMVSLNFSEFTTNRGIGLEDASKVNSISFGLNPATAQGQDTEVNADLIIFTVGEKLLGGK